MKTYQERRHRKMLTQILNIPSVTERNMWENCSNKRIFAIIYRPRLLGNSITSMKILEQCRYKLYHHDIR